MVGAYGEIVIADFSFSDWTSVLRQTRVLSSLISTEHSSSQDGACSQAHFTCAFIQPTSLRVESDLSAWLDHAMQQKVEVHGCAAVARQQQCSVQHTKARRQMPDDFQS